MTAPARDTWGECAWTARDLLTLAQCRWILDRMADAFRRAREQGLERQ